MQMWRGDYGALPVVTAAGKVVGMITDRDICMAAAIKHRDPANIRVKEMMSGKVYGCSCDTDIHEALKIMQQKQVRRLPIIKRRRWQTAGHTVDERRSIENARRQRSRIVSRRCGEHDARDLRAPRAASGKTNGVAVANDGGLAPSMQL